MDMSLRIQALLRTTGLASEMKQSRFVDIPGETNICFPEAISPLTK